MRSVEQGTAVVGGMKRDAPGGLRGSSRPSRVVQATRRGLPRVGADSCDSVVTVQASAPSRVSVSERAAVAGVVKEASLIGIGCRDRQARHAVDGPTLLGGAVIRASQGYLGGCFT